MGELRIELWECGAELQYLEDVFFYNSVCFSLLFSEVLSRSTIYSIVSTVPGLKIAIALAVTGNDHVIALHM